MFIALLISQQSVFALLNIDGTRNQVFVFGSATIGFDSNVFAEQVGRSDYIYSASLGVELKRRAGIIAVNARVVFDYQKFAQNSDQTSWNPNLFLELNKTIGRTTGALTINGYRSSKADSAVNVRTQSWNFPLGLNIKYPVNDKLYLTSSTGYLKRSFVNTTQLLNYTDYSQAFDFFYVYTSKLDIVGGYRIRIGNTNVNTTTDHNFTLGLANALLPKVHGVLRLGYQFREVDNTGAIYSHFNIAATLTWNVTRKLTASAQITRDFSTTAVGGSIDTFNTLVRANYVFSRRWEAEAGVGYGKNEFLDGPARTDEYFTWNIGGTFTWSEHFRLSATYEYMNNWSTNLFSNFERTGYSLHVASRF